MRYGTLGLLLSAMSALGAVLQDCSAAAAQVVAAAGAAGVQRQQGWLALHRWLQQAARQQLPDPTLLLALLAAAEKEGWADGEECGAAGSCVSAAPTELSHYSSRMDVLSACMFQATAHRPLIVFLPAPLSSCPTANELQLTAVLRLLLLWQRLLPAALAEANVDAERLVPGQPLALRPQHQLLLLELLHASADADTASAAGAAEGDGSSRVGPSVPATTMSGASLLPPLRLLVGSPVAAVRAEAHSWLLRRLLATGAFGGNQEEACLWLDLLPRCVVGCASLFVGALRACCPVASVGGSEPFSQRPISA